MNHHCQLHNFDIVDILSRNRDHVPDWVKVTLTSLPTPKVTNKLSAYRWLSLNDPIFAVNNKRDIEAFVQHKIQQAPFEQVINQGAPSISQFKSKLVNIAQGNFLFIAQLLSDAPRGILLVDKIEQLPRGLTGYYTGFFKRRMTLELYKQPMREVLEILVAAREPLTESEIAFTCQRSLEYEIRPILSSLSEFLYRQWRNADSPRL